ncbi:UNVERIFIED_CONTAM: hypothetical protein Sradi_2695400 [Sesamum radiatum]|uniref:Uncharacterized protein n=1 Tax=Sesamum radiatum TaxID=300843 RepID=A0AAW2S8V9_SESRA
MCTTRDHSGQAPFKDLKPPHPPEKKGDVLTTSLKAAVAIILTFSICLALYFTTRPVFFHWPDVPDPPLYMTELYSDHSPTNISHIAFGIGASTGTWEKRLHYSDIWWKPNITRGFVFLEKNPDPRTASEIRHRVSSDWKRFKRSAGSESAVRLAPGGVDLFRAGLPNVRWFVMGTTTRCSSPRTWWRCWESTITGVWYHYFYGSDQRVWACVGELGVGLSREPGFHQIDIRGDPFGLLAAHPLAPLVSLHHLDSVKPLFPNKTQLDSLQALMKAYEVDPSRTLQQSFCYHRRYKWSVSVSWGYVVQIYPTLLTAKELEMPLLTFRTWRSWKEGPFTFNTRPWSSDPCQQPIIFYLNSVREDSAGDTITMYRKFAVETDKKCGRKYACAMAIENVVVSAPRMDPEEWKQVCLHHHCLFNCGS